MRELSAGGASTSSSGQVSVEYILVSAAMMVVLILLVVVFNGLYAQESLRAQYLEASHNVMVLKSRADDVWRQGEGARDQVVLSIPQAANLSASYVGPNAINLNVIGFGDVSAAVDFPINGSWPVHTGTWLAGLYHNGTHVLIRPAGRLSINVSGVYASLGPSSSKSKKILYKNDANVSYTVNQTLVCPPTITCSYNASGVSSISSGGSLISQLNVTTSTTLGNFSGNLSVNVTPASGSGLPNETFVLPITIIAG